MIFFSCILIILFTGQKYSKTCYFVESHKLHLSWDKLLQPSSCDLSEPSENPSGTFLKVRLVIIMLHKTNFLDQMGVCNWMWTYLTTQQTLKLLLIAQCTMSWGKEQLLLFICKEPCVCLTVEDWKKKKKLIAYQSLVFFMPLFSPLSLYFQPFKAGSGCRSF